MRPPLSRVAPPQLEAGLGREVGGDLGDGVLGDGVDWMERADAVVLAKDLHFVPGTVTRSTPASPAHLSAAPAPTCAGRS